MFTSILKYDGRLPACVKLCVSNGLASVITGEKTVKPGNIESVIVTLSGRLTKLGGEPEILNKHSL